jgi:hypothetical protein
MDYFAKGNQHKLLKTGNLRQKYPQGGGVPTGNEKEVHRKPMHLFHRHLERTSYLPRVGAAFGALTAAAPVLTPSIVA